MNAPIPTTLPLRPAAHALMRDRFEALPDAEMAAVDFGPWELADFCEVPTPKEWQARHREALVAMKIAGELVRLDKAGVVERLVDMEGAGLDEFMAAVGLWVDRFRSHLALLEAVQDRLIIGSAVLLARTEADEAAAGGAA